MTPEYLKELLPSLLNADFAGATNVRLLSLARTYAALCDLATFDFPSGEYGTRKIWLQRIDTLFGVLRERCRRESDAALRCRMVHAMYTLVCGTVSGDVSKRKGVCFAMADELVRDCLGGNEKRSSLRPDESELLIRTGVCHCLIDLLYPGPGRATISAAPETADFRLDRRNEPGRQLERRVAGCCAGACRRDEPLLVCVP